MQKMCNTQMLVQEDCGFVLCILQVYFWTVTHTLVEIHIECLLCTRYDCLSIMCECVTDDT